MLAAIDLVVVGIEGLFWMLPQLPLQKGWACSLWLYWAKRGPIGRSSREGSLGRTLYHQSSM